MAKLPTLPRGLRYEGRPEDMTQDWDTGQVTVTFTWDASWRVALTLAAAGQGVSGFSITPAEPTVPRGGLRSGALRRFHLQAAENAARVIAAEELRAIVKNASIHVLPDLAHRIEDDATTVESPRRPGPRQMPLTELARLAADYLELVPSGQPIKLLAEREHLAASTVRQRLYLARERGLLESRGQGIAGGDLTPLARRLLGKD